MSAEAASTPASTGAGSHDPSVEEIISRARSMRLGSGSALLVVDMQNGFLAPDGSFARMGFDVGRLRAAVDGCADLAHGARSAGVPVIFTRFVYQAGYADAGVTSRELFPGIRQQGGLAHGSWDAEIIPEMAPSETDFVIDKSRYSSFYGTRLEPLLTGMGIRTLVVCGITTNMCVESTVRDAAQRDYRTVVVADATEEFTRERREHALLAMGYGFAWVAERDRVIGEWAASQAASER